MKLPVSTFTLACLGATALMLSGCGKDFNEGFGETQGWGGYTKGFGDVDEGLDTPVGLCSYTGGCMPSGWNQGVTANSYKGDLSGAHAPDHSVDSGTGDSN